MSLRKERVLGRETDFVVMLSEDPKTASVFIMQKDSCVRVDAAVWSKSQWKEYINRRIKASEAGHFLGMNLLENEK